MDIVTEQQRAEQIDLLPEEMGVLYFSPASGIHLYGVYKKFLHDDTIYNNYVEIVGDTILGFYKTTELPKLFQEKLMIGADQAQRMTADLLEFLSPVIEREQAESNIKKEDIAKLAEVFETASKKPQPVEEEKEPEPVKTSENIQPLRTMERDMNRVHGYGAYREQNPLPTDTTPTVVSNQDSVLTSVPKVTPKLVETPNLTGEEKDEDDGSVRVPIKPAD